MNDINDIEKKLIRLNNMNFIPTKQEKFAKEIYDELINLKFKTSKMGSTIKNTAITNSDIDIFVEMKQKLTPDDAINLICQKLIKFQPKPKNKSVQFTRNKVLIEVIPGYPVTGKVDEYRIPDKTKSPSVWINRGHTKFAKEFNQADNRIDGKLSTAVKVLKIWDSNKGKLPLSSLFYEVICYNNLKKANNKHKFAKLALRCFKTMKRDFLKKIQNPTGGPSLNTLSKSDRQKWVKIAKKDYDKLKDYKLDNWDKVFGTEFSKI